MKFLTLSLFLIVGFTFVGCKDQPPKVISLTTADFLTKVHDYNTNKEWKYLGNKPAIIDFYATWCGPCKKIAPVLDQLAGEYQDQITIYKVDVDQEPELAIAFGIKSIPSLLFIPMGQAPQMAQGGSKAELEGMIQSTLLNKKD